MAGRDGEEASARSRIPIAAGLLLAFVLGLATQLPAANGNRFRVSDRLKYPMIAYNLVAHGAYYAKNDYAGRLERAGRLFPPDEARREGVELAFLNRGEVEGGRRGVVDLVRDFTDGAMMDDAFVFCADAGLVAEADALLGQDGCLSMFAGPTSRDFTAELNLYGVHYEGHHVLGTTGGDVEGLSKQEINDLVEFVLSL